MSTTPKHVRINETTLKSLKPRGKPWFIKDEAQRGFQIKINPSGQASYFVEARLGGVGKVKRFKIGNVGDLSLTEAREQARQALVLIRSGNDPQAEKRSKLHEGMTLEQLLETFLSRASAQRYKKRTIEGYNYYFNKHFKSWKKKRVKDLTKHEIVDWYNRGSQTPTEIDNAFRHLNAVLNYAVGLEIISTNPCELLKKNRIRFTRTQRTRHLEPEDDLGKFLRAFIGFEFVKDSQKTARDMIILMLTTGLRFDEARTITFPNVNFDKKTLLIPDTKNRRDHLIPLVALTFTMLRYRKEIHEKEGGKSDYVFRIKGGKTKSPYVTDLRKTLNKICDSANIQRISPHDLRRTFASTLNNIGIGFVDVKALMNHKDKDVTIMYIQNHLSRLRDVLIKVVRYYDFKILFPENTKKGIEDAGLDVIQAALYGNIEPTFAPLTLPLDVDHEASLEKDYWYGIDA